MMVAKVAASSAPIAPTELTALFSRPNRLAKLKSASHVSTCSWPMPSSARRVSTSPTMELN